MVLNCFFLAPFPKNLLANIFIYAPFSFFDTYYWKLHLFDLKQGALENLAPIFVMVGGGEGDFFYV